MALGKSGNTTPRLSQATDREFEKELEIFRTEADAAQQFFYAWMGVHAAAADDKAVYRCLNSAALFWNTNLGALQTATFVTLGRIFDQNSIHNVGRLLKLAQDNPQIFSKAALALRKQGKNKTPPDWLDDYMRHVHVPKPHDFRRLRSYVSKHRRIYERNYRDLRNHIFAHKGVSDPEAVAALFAKTNIRELERLLGFLSRLHDALWNTLMNGRKPVLRPRRYSVKSMREKPSPHHRGAAVHERILHEAGRFLSDAAKSASQTTD